MFFYKKPGKIISVSLLLLLIFLSFTACGRKSEKLILQLEDNPASGFEWDVYQADKIFGEERSYEEKSNKAEGGTTTFTLTPEESGFTNVVFSYKMKKGEEISLQYSYSIIIDENYGIEVVSSEGKLGESNLTSDKIPVPVIR